MQIDVMTRKGLYMLIGAFIKSRDLIEFSVTFAYV